MNCEWVSLDVAAETRVSVHGLATLDDHVLAAVLTWAPETPDRREARILHAPARDLTAWRELFRTSLPSDWVEIGGQRRRLTIDQGFFGFVRWPQPEASPLFVALVSVQGSALLEVTPALDVRVHPNRSPEAGMPPLGRLFPAEDHLLALSAGSRSADDAARTAGGRVRPYQSTDPASGAWSPLWPADGGGTPSLSGLACAGGRLYAATADPKGGFSLWQAALPVGGAPEWSLIVDQGAFRYTLNATVSAITPHTDGSVYLATVAAGASGLGNHGPEILRIAPDSRWEIVVGEPRFTPEGFKRPLSRLGPGFGDRRAGAITRLLSTSDGLLAVHQLLTPEDVRRRFGRYCGGTAFWSSHNGVDWCEADVDAVPDLGEVQASAITPQGLLLGGSGVAIPGGTGAHTTGQSNGAGFAPGALILLSEVTGPRSC